MSTQALFQSISKNSIILTLFALFTAALLAFTFVSTKDRIAEQERLAAEKALLEIMPRQLHDNNMLEYTWPIPSAWLGELGLKETQNIFVATREGKIIGFILPAVAHDGYSGDIKLLVGILRNGEISGVRAISHKETPGLGDHIDANKGDWILKFVSKSLQNPSRERWKVKKDGGAFDQFTGATITPRAVVRQTRQALEFFEQHRDDILATLEPQP